jgi:hypothetical protein
MFTLRRYQPSDREAVIHLHVLPFSKQAPTWDAAPGTTISTPSKKRISTTRENF